jgi:hypothetical protein
LANVDGNSFLPQVFSGGRSGSKDRSFPFLKFVRSSPERALENGAAFPSLFRPVALIAAIRSYICHRSCSALPGMAVGYWPFLSGLTGGSVSKPRRSGVRTRFDYVAAGGIGALANRQATKRCCAHECRRSFEKTAPGRPRHLVVLHRDFATSTK